MTTTMTTTPPTPPLDLDEIEAVFDTAAETGARIDLATGRRLLAEVRRLRAVNAQLDGALGETIDDRDQAHEILDKLAYAVAPIEVIGEHSSMNCPWTNALDLITPAAEVDKLRARIAELEGPAVEARAALAALCYDLEDPGSNAFGALYLISQATVGVEAPKDDAALALMRHAREVLHEVADMADPDEPEVSFFGPTFGPQVAGWLRMLADRPARPAAVAAAGDTDGANA